jgi:hypothetical protein
MALPMTVDLKKIGKYALKQALWLAILIVCATLGGVIASTFSDHEKIVFLSIFNVVLIVLVLGAMTAHRSK